MNSSLESNSRKQAWSPWEKNHQEDQKEKKSDTDVTSTIDRWLQIRP